jgi:rare lipoprotein A (peptidoglycan hydrolase)
LLGRVGGVGAIGLEGRVVDVTKDAAEALGFVARGVAEVSVATIN